MAQCAITSCKFRVRKNKVDSVMLHKFPRDGEMRRKWRVLCRRDKSFKAEWSAVCSEHFRPEDYVRDLKAELLGIPPKRILKRDAVPSLKLVPESGTFACVCSTQSLISDVENNGSVRVTRRKTRQMCKCGALRKSKTKKKRSSPPKTSQALEVNNIIDTSNCSPSNDVNKSSMHEPDLLMDKVSTNTTNISTSASNTPLPTDVRIVRSSGGNVSNTSLPTDVRIVRSSGGNVAVPEQKRPPVEKIITVNIKNNCKRCEIREAAMDAILAAFSNKKPQCDKSTNTGKTEVVDAKLNKRLRILQSRDKWHKARYTALEARINHLKGILSTYQKNSIKITKSGRNKPASFENLEKVFTKNQIQFLLRGSRRCRWTDEDMALPVALKQISKKAYVFLRDKGFPFPSISCMKKWKALRRNASSNAKEVSEESASQLLNSIIQDSMSIDCVTEGAVEDDANALPNDHDIASPNSPMDLLHRAINLTLGAEEEIGLTCVTAEKTLSEVMIPGTFFKKQNGMKIQMPKKSTERKRLPKKKKILCTGETPKVPKKLKITTACKKSPILAAALTSNQTCVSGSLSSKIPDSVEYCMHEPSLLKDATLTLNKTSEQTLTPPSRIASTSAAEILISSRDIVSTSTAQILLPSSDAVSTSASEISSTSSDHSINTVSQTRSHQPSVSSVPQYVVMSPVTSKNTASLSSPRTNFTPLLSQKKNMRSILPLPPANMISSQVILVPKHSKTESSSKTNLLYVPVLPNPVKPSSMSPTCPGNAAAAASPKKTQFSILLPSSLQQQHPSPASKKPLYLMYVPNQGNSQKNSQAPEISENSTV